MTAFNSAAVPILLISEPCLKIDSGQDYVHSLTVHIIKFQVSEMK